VKQLSNITIYSNTNITMHRNINITIYNNINILYIVLLILKDYCYTSQIFVEMCRFTGIVITRLNASVFLKNTFFISVDIYKKLAI